MWGRCFWGLKLECGYEKPPAGTDSGSRVGRSHGAGAGHSAYGEGETEEEAIVDLKEAVSAYIEVFGMEDATSRLNRPSALRHLDLELQDLMRA